MLEDFRLNVLKAISTENLSNKGKHKDTKKNLQHGNSLNTV